MVPHFAALLLVLLHADGARGFSTSLHTVRSSHKTRVASSSPQMLRGFQHRISMEEPPGGWSTKVKITAETRAPLRQARIFFLYPSIVAGASIAAYVSLIRVIGGADAMTDALNLATNAGVVAGAVFLLKKDLDGRAELLEQVAIELGEMKDPNEPDEDAAELEEDGVAEATAKSRKKKKKKKQN